MKKIFLILLFFTLQSFGQKVWIQQSNGSSIHLPNATISGDSVNIGVAATVDSNIFITVTHLNSFNYSPLAGSASLTTTSQGTLGSMSAADSLEIFSRFGNETFVKRTADTSYSALFPPLNIGGLQFSVMSAGYYTFDAYLLYQSAATGAGLKIRTNAPSMTVWGEQVDIGGESTNGTSGSFHGYISAITDSVDATATKVANKTMVCHIFGSFVPSANGTFSIQYASSSTTAVTIKQGSFLRYWTH